MLKKKASFVNVKDMYETKPKASQNSSEGGGVNPSPVPTNNGDEPNDGD